MIKTIPVNTNDGDVLCGHCRFSLSCNESGDMPDVCPGCGHPVKWEDWMEPGEELRFKERVLEAIENVIETMNNVYAMIANDIGTLSEAKDVITSTILKLNKEMER